MRELEANSYRVKPTLRIWKSTNPNHGHHWYNFVLRGEICGACKSSAMPMLVAAAIERTDATSSRTEEKS